MLELRALFTTNFLSLVGNSLSAIAIPWFVYDLTGSATGTAGIVIAGQLPSLFAGILSGPVIDRFPPKRVAIFCDVINLIAILAIPLFFHLEVLDMILLSGLVFLSQLFDVPGQTAKSVLLPELIDRHKLRRERVNGTASFLESSADLLGPALAGVLITSVGVTFVLVIDGATFAVAALIVAVGIKSSSRAETSADMKSNLQTSWRWMLGQSLILRLALFDMLTNMVAVTLLSLALPVLANKQSGQAVWLGFWLSSFAAGTMLTAVAFSFLGHRVAPSLILRATPIGQALGLGLVGISVSYFAHGNWQLAGNFCICAGLFIYGLNLGFGSLVDATILQKKTPAAQRGTVFAAFSSIRYAGVPVGLLIGGVALDVAHPGFLFLGFMAILISCCFFVAGSRDVIH